MLISSVDEDEEGHDAEMEGAMLEYDDEDLDEDEADGGIDDGSQSGSSLRGSLRASRSSRGRTATNADSPRGGAAPERQRAPPSLRSAPRAPPEVIRRVNAWAEGKDFYDMTSSLGALLGVRLAPAGPSALEMDEDEVEHLEHEQAGAEEGGLERDDATPASLERAWARVEATLSGDALAALPAPKRAVAAELYRVAAAAYEAELIVLEEIALAEGGLAGR